MPRFMLRLWALGVPLTHRDRWMEEWEAELVALEAREKAQSNLSRWWTTTRFAMGARAHAAEVARLNRTKTTGKMTMTNVWRDLKYSVRSFGRAPGFTVVAVLTLALGIGATTTMFSVLDGVVLRPLPYDRPEGLVMLGSTSQRMPGLAPVSPADFIDWRAGNTTFSHMIATEWWSLDLIDTDRPARISSAAVSGGFFEMLGVEPFLGRGISMQDDVEGAPPVVVLSHGLWERRYSSNPQIVGSLVRTADQSFTVVGVMPQSFVHPEALWAEDVELWMPTSQTGSNMTTRNGRFLQVMGRLRPDASLSQARQEMTALATALAEEHPQNVGRQTLIEPLQSETIGDVGQALTLLMGAVGMLLMIACVNVANLFMARAADRGREIAVRIALGAGRARIRGQLLTEGVILSLIGGLAGLALAYGGVWAFRTLNPVGIPRVGSVTVDGRILVFAFVVSVVTGVAFALAPALRLSRTRRLAALRDGARAGSGVSAGQFRNLLVAAEMGLAVVLMVGAGLFMNSFLRLQSVDPGFNSEDVVTMALTLNSQYSEIEQQETFLRQLTDEIATLRGVESVAYTSALPFAGGRYLTGVALEGRDLDPDNPDYAEYSTTSEGFFSTMGIEVIAGREITQLDNASSPPVVLVNQAFARRYWPGEDPLGQRVSTSRREPVWHDVVGVVGDVKRQGLDEPSSPEIYLSPLQFGITEVHLVARIDGDLTEAVTGMRSIMTDLDGTLPTEFNTVEAYVADSVNQSQFYTQLFGAFAVVALVLAGVGVYGTMSYAVGQRTRELGIRLALGAESGTVTAMVARQGLWVAFVGLALGLISAAAGARLLESFLFGVDARDPLTYAAGAIFLGLVAGAACWIPARRAGKADPMHALRME